MDMSLSELRELGPFLFFADGFAGGPVGQLPKALQCRQSSVWLVGWFRPSAFV